MGGIEARDGFWFQDARILVRLLRDAVARRARMLEGGDVHDPLRIKIEAPTEAAPPLDHAPRPPWDSVTYEEGRVIVDETKLGEVSRSERLALYRRIRATCASRGSAANIVPRLTTATGAQSNPEKWRDLAAASRAVRPPAVPPSPVADAEALAAEAIYCLTSELVPNDRGELVRSPVPPMGLEEARTVLQGFQFDDELDLVATEAELRRLLTILGAALSIDQVVQQLRGWIATKACARPGGAELSCESIEAELSLLARYLAVPGDAERLWHRLQGSAPPSIESRVPLRGLREAQPVAAAMFDDDSIQRVALIGSGGIGKSFVLMQRFAETPGWRIWIDATAGAENLEEALALGVWAAARREAQLAIFVDGLDQAPDRVRVLGAVDRAIAGSQARAVVAARPTTWAAISESAPRWREARLDRWSLESVAAATRKISGISIDLIDLLRTPLLLDLYLRTVGGEKDATAFHPTSRHELVTEYFARRILPANAASSSERRAFISSLGANVAQGRSRWTITQADERELALGLVGEGLLVDSFGRFRFRHALLQDVCVALALSSTSARDCADAVQKVASATLRHDVMRSLMEAALARGGVGDLMDTPPVHDLVRELVSRELPAADSAGDVVVVPDDVNSFLGSGLDVGSVLRWARAAENRSWLTGIARLPATTRPAWLGPATLGEDLCEIARDITAPGITEETSRALAVRLRSWAQRDLQPQGWSMPTIVEAILRFAPTKETVEWLSSLPTLPSADYCSLLERLRLIASLDRSVDDGMLADLILRGFESIGRTGSLLPQRADRDRATHAVVMSCFQAGEKTPSIFDTKPRAAFRVLFELVARHGEARRREREEQERAPGYQEMMAEIARAFAVELSQVPAEAETTAQPEADEPRTEPGIIEDVPLIGWSPDLYPLHAAWVSAAARLSDPAVAAIAREEALRSRSRAARNLVDDRDAKIRECTTGGWSEGAHRPEEPLPANIPETMGRAWRALELIVRARGRGITSSVVERGTLAAVLATQASIDLMPVSVLRRIPYVLNHYREHASVRELEGWADTLLAWLEQGSTDNERAVEAVEAIDECLAGAQVRNDVLLVRFSKVFTAQFSRASSSRKGDLIRAAFRLLREHEDTRDLLVRFARSHPEGDVLSEVMIAFLNAPHATFLAIAEELLGRSDKILPYDPLVEMGRWLGALCCYPAVRAWSMVRGWLHARPASATLSDPKSWRQFLDSVGNGASHHATVDIGRYVDIATELWAAWQAAPQSEIHGLVWTLFSCTNGSDDELNRALVTSMAPLACDVLARENGFDLAGLDDIPWALLPPRQLDEIVTALAQRIAKGPAEPDEYNRFSASIDDLVKGLASCPTLTADQAERLYIVVQPAMWLLHREARCNQLLARVRVQGES